MNSINKVYTQIVDVTLEHQNFIVGQPRYQPLIHNFAPALVSISPVVSCLVHSLTTAGCKVVRAHRFVGTPEGRHDQVRQQVLS